MENSINQQNKQYWQTYRPGEIPTIPKNPPDSLLKHVTGRVLDVGVGDGLLAEELVNDGFDVFGIDIAENFKRKSKVHYSVQDITATTEFSDGFFDLIIFRFTLTNIHRESWKNVGNEVFRVLKSGGRIWVLEPLVSESYAKRYELAANFVEDKNCVFVFHDKNLAEKISTKEQLEKAIADKSVSRIIKHYSQEELLRVFDKFHLDEQRTIEVASPSGYKIKTFEGIFVKQ